MDDDTFDATIVHAVALERVAAGNQAAVLAELKTLEGSILTKLSQAETLKPTQVTKFTALLKSTNKTIDGSYAKIIEQSNGDLTKLQHIEVAEVTKQLNGRVKADIFTGRITEELAEQVVKPPVNFGLEVSKWWEAQGDDYKTKFESEMRQGILLGESVDDLVKRVRGTRDQEFTNGLAEIKRRHATALVRTSVISTTNQAKIDAFSKLPMVKGIEWLATLDSRTTNICMGLSGLQWRLPDYEPIGHDKAFPGSSAHWNERSTQVAVLYSWQELGAKKVPVLANSTVNKAIEKRLKADGKTPEFIAAAKKRSRASIDGPVSVNKTFESWLSGKSDEFKSDLLGPGRFELWNSGAISLKQLTDQQNRPLTLDQLEALTKRKGITPPKTPSTFLPVDPAKIAALSDDNKAEVDRANAAAAAEKKRAKEAEAEANRQRKELKRELRKRLREITGVDSELDTIEELLAALEEALRFTDI